MSGRHLYSSRAADQRQFWRRRCRAWVLQSSREDVHRFNSCCAPTGHLQSLLWGQLHLLALLLMAEPHLLVCALTSATQVEAQLPFSQYHCVLSKSCVIWLFRCCVSLKAMAFIDSTVPEQLLGAVRSWDATERPTSGKGKVQLAMFVRLLLSEITLNLELTPEHAHGSRRCNSRCRSRWLGSSCQYPVGQ